MRVADTGHYVGGREGGQNRCAATTFVAPCSSGARGGEPVALAPALAVECVGGSLCHGFPHPATHRVVTQVDGVRQIALLCASAAQLVLDEIPLSYCTRLDGPTAFDRPGVR